MNKTLRALVLPLALFFTLSTVTAPARAVLPLVAAGVALISEGGLAANGLAALTVGTVAGMIYLGNLQSGTGASDGSGSYMEIPLGTSRSRPMATPPGYTAPVNNNAQPTPPATVTGIQEWRVGFTDATNGLGYVPGTSSVAACQNFVAMWNSIYTLAYMVIAYDSVTVDLCKYHYVQSGSLSERWNTPQTICSAGYTMAGSTCTLTNAAAVMKPADGRCHILASVSGFTIDPQDPECSGLAAQTGTTVTPTKITQTKTGTLTNGTVTINPDGSRTIVYSHGDTVNNTTTITTINMIPAAGGQTAQVTGSSTVVVAGTGNLAAPATPAAPTIDFPDDYNREATQAAIKSDVAEIKTAITTAPVAPNTLPGPSAAIDQAANDHKSAIEALAVAGANNHGFIWDWSPMIPTATCSPAVISAGGRSVTLEWCPVVEKVREISGYALYLVTAWSLFFILTARREN